MIVYEKQTNIQKNEQKKSQLSNIPLKHLINNLAILSTSSSAIPFLRFFFRRFFFFWLWLEGSFEAVVVFVLTLLREKMTVQLLRGEVQAHTHNDTVCSVSALVSIVRGVCFFCERGRGGGKKWGRVASWMKIACFESSSKRKDEKDLSLQQELFFCLACSHK